MSIRPSLLRVTLRNITFQQAYWPKLLELEYPEEQQSQWEPLTPLLDKLWEENQVDYLLELPTCLEEMLEEFCLELHHLLVEAVEAVEAVEPLEEGEIHPNRYP